MSDPGRADQVTVAAGGVAALYAAGVWWSAPVSSAIVLTVGAVAFLGVAGLAAVRRKR